MKKSKLVIALILAATALVSLFALSACGKGEGQIQVHEHTFTDRALKTAATCTQKAVYYKVCSVCGERGDTFEDGNFAAHDYDWFDVIEDATVCVGHKQVHLCKVCSHQDEDNSEQIVLPHSDTWAVASKPTKDSEGKLVGVCKACDLPAEITLPVLKDENGGGKFYNVTVNTAASCNVPGVKKYVYVADGQSFEFTVTTTVMHVLNGKEIAARSEAPGEVNYIEGYLGNHTVADLLNGALGNQILFVNGSKLTCADEGADCIFKCDACHTSYSTWFKKAHDEFSEALQSDAQKKANVAPTCDVDGVKYYTCSGCKQQMTKTIPAIGHNFKYTLTPVTSVDENGDETKTWSVLGVCTHEFNGVKCSGADNKTGIPDSSVTVKQEATCSKGAIYRYVYSGVEILFEDPETDVLHRYYDSASKVDKRVEGTVNNSTRVYDISELPNITVLGEPKNNLCSDKGNLAVFKCADCGDSFTVLVKYPHSKPASSSLITHTAATCEKDEITSYNCTECGELVEIHGEKAFGHDITVDIIAEPDATSTGKVRIHCKNKGCGVDEEITLAALVVKEDGTADGYTVKTVTEKSNVTECATRTVTTYTYVYSDELADKNLPEITFTQKGDWQSGHDKSGSGQTVIRVGINGNYYEGYICSYCNKFIIIREV